MSNLIQALNSVDCENVDDALADVIFAVANKVAKVRLSKRQYLTSPELAADLLVQRYRHLDYEIFGIIYLDNQHRIIDIDENLMSGTIDGASIYPRRVLKACLEKGAAAIAIFHNHPSSETTPSRADINITNRISEALQYIDVRLLDHYILGGGEFTSFAKNGIL